MCLLIHKHAWEVLDANDDLLLNSDRNEKEGELRKRTAEILMQHDEEIRSTSL